MIQFRFFYKLSTDTNYQQTPWQNSPIFDLNADFNLQYDYYAQMRDDARSNMPIWTSPVKQFVRGVLAPTIDVNAIDVDDRVTLLDDGQGKWVKYEISVQNDGSFANAGKYIYQSQEKFEAEMTAEDIKTAYESNDDTNAFTDDEKQKLDDLVVVENLQAKVAEIKRWSSDVSVTANGTIDLNNVNTRYIISGAVTVVTIALDSVDPLENGQVVEFLNESAQTVTLGGEFDDHQQEAGTRLQIEKTATGYRATYI